MKKLFISIFTCVFALFALGTATFAWFSMNETVTAQGMSVTAKSDQTYLLIAPGHGDAESVQGLKLTVANASNASKELLPAAHDSAFANIAAVETETNWYYQTSDDPTSATGTSAQLPLEGGMANYVLVNEFSITVAKGANPVKDIKVNTCTITAEDAEAVKVIVATAYGCEEFSGTGARGSEVTPAVLSSGNLTDAQTLLVKVYIYWDGNDSDVFTNNRAHLLNTTVNVTFTGSAVNA